MKSLPHLKRLKHDDTKITAAGLDRLRHLDRTAATAVADRPQAPEPRKDPGGVAKPDDVTPARIRAAVAKALPPLQKSLVVYAEKRDCFSCHNQAVPLVALEIARSRGLAIDDDAFQGAVALTLADLESALGHYRKGRGQPGGVTRAAYALWTLEAGGHPADEITAAVTEYLLKADRDRDHWTESSRRPPIEASHFTDHGPGAAGACGIYGAKGRADAVKDRARQARAWLAKSQPADTEDRVFRLWGLKYAAATPDELEAAAKDLLAAQRDDGGWAQTDKLASDAYATGSALVALHQAGGLATDDPAYRRGVAFLLRTQKADGTWFVASRSQPVPALLRERLPLRQGPVHRRGRERLGRRRAGPGPAGESHSGQGPTGVPAGRSWRGDRSGLTPPSFDPGSGARISSPWAPQQRGEGAQRAGEGFFTSPNKSRVTQRRDFEAGGGFGTGLMSLPECPNLARHRYPDPAGVPEPGSARVS